jgi:hypothetical protein
MRMTLQHRRQNKIVERGGNNRTECQLILVHALQERRTRVVMPAF